MALASTLRGVFALEVLPLRASASYEISSEET
jgi:hypothetical protein